MSRAVVAGAYGGPEVLEIIDETVKPPGSEQVQIEVRAAAVNVWDVKSYSGSFGDDPAKLPMRLGAEASGVVTAVGENAVGPSGPISIGDEVIAYEGVSGAYASQLVVPASAVIAKATALSWEQAAGLMLTGVAAVHLATATGISSADTVLIHAASGGVGLMATQIALARGAAVVGTGFPATHETLRSLGAVPVEFGDGLADRVRLAAPGGITAALDCIGTDEALNVSLELVADHSRIATIVNFDGALRTGIKALGYGPGADPGSEIRSAARLELAALAAQGKVHVVVDRTFPLTEARAAHEYIAAGHAKGKVILVP